LSQLLTSACLVTEDAGARARKSTNRGQLPDIWKLPASARGQRLEVFERAFALLADPDQEQ
jgi:hypothetical protein